ncbi:unnamed protein product [Peniophora sp. CBMAI 1063]|nr:unnamed protein product [Peniophora sp. CBMAI 1063]
MQLLDLLSPHLIPGERSVSNDTLSLGWTTFAGVHPVVRSWLLAEHDRWADVVCAVSRPPAVETFIRLSDNAPATVDFDTLFSSAREDDITSLTSFFFNPTTLEPTSTLLNARALFAMDIMDTAVTTARQMYIESIGRVFMGRTFVHLSSLVLHIRSEFPSFTAPALSSLELIGVRVVHSSPHPPTYARAWKQTPVAAVSDVHALMQSAHNLRSVSLVDIDVRGSASSAPPLDLPFLDRCVFESRSPSSLQNALDVFRAQEDTDFFAICRLSYSESLPDWAWTASGLDRSGPLALVVESCMSVVWLTFMTTDDAAKAPRPVYCDAVDAHSIAEARADRPTLFIRPFRISRLYIPQKVTSYKRALTRDVDNYSTRIRDLYVVEMALKLNGEDVWLRKLNTLVPDILRPAAHISSLIIEDERFAHLPLYAPKSCSQVYVYCREDWYGKSYLQFLPQSVAARQQFIKDVYVGGVKRSRDSIAISALRALPVHFHDRRSTSSRPAPGTYHSQELDLARDILHYHELKVLAIEAELDMERKN